MNQSVAHQTSLRVGTEMLGVERADKLACAADTGFGSRFSGYVMDFVFGEIWAASSLSRRELSPLSLGVLTALGRADSLASYVAMARTNGLGDKEIEDAITHLAAYAGFPAANAAMAVARNVLANGKGDEQA